MSLGDRAKVCFGIFLLLLLRGCCDRIEEIIKDKGGSNSVILTKLLN